MNVLIKPYFYQARRYLFKELAKPTSKTLSIGLFIAALIAICFFGMQSSLVSAAMFAEHGFLPPQVLLALILLGACSFVFISACVTSLTLLFENKDSDLILSSPISPARLFAGRFLQLCLHSMWLGVLVLVPMLAAFGSHYGAESNFYLIALVGVPLLLTIPTNLALTLMIALSRFIPAHRGKELLLVLMLALLAVLALIFPGASDPVASQETLISIAVFSSENLYYLPSHWLAIVLASTLGYPSPSPSIFFLSLLLFALIGVLVSSLVFFSWHQSALQYSLSKKPKLEINSRRLRRYLGFIHIFFDSQYRAIAGKELKLFARDPTQVVQLAIILFLSLFFISNLRMLQGVEFLDGEASTWWQIILYFSNYLLCGFVLIGITSRFVYPAISVEGKAFWILESGPLSRTELLTIKARVWTIPIGIIVLVLALSGCFAVQSDLSSMALVVFSCLMLSHGMAALAIGIGTIFSDFEWQHASQVNSSVGNLIFLVLSLIFLLVSSVPVVLLLFMLQLSALGVSDTEIYLKICVVGLILFFIFANHIIVDSVLSRAAQALRLRIV